MTWNVDAVKKLRDDRDWTQRQLADVLGVSLRSVQMWEGGEPISKRNQRLLDRLVSTEETDTLTDAELRALVPKVLPHATDGQVISEVANRFARSGSEPTDILPGPYGRWVWTRADTTTGTRDKDGPHNVGRDTNG